MDNTAIQEAMDNPGRPFVLAGKTYVFKEPGRRRGRDVLKGIAMLIEKYPDIQKGFSIASIAIVNDILDFLYEAVPFLRDDKQYIDDNAEADEIMQAFQCVIEVVQRPFVGGKKSTASNETPAETSSVNGE